MTIRSTIPAGRTHGLQSLPGYNLWVPGSDTTEVSPHPRMHVNAVIFSPIEFLCIAAKDAKSQTVSVPVHQENHTQAAA